MGSGKSYEVVSSVIIPAVAAGRRVVTNVDGIDGDAICAYVCEKQGIPLDKLGEVIHCSKDDVPKDDFFPYGENVDTFVKPGDLVCIDEAWRFWGTGSKVLKTHAIFFREHRHYVQPDTKVSCDLVLMVQDISDLHRTLKVVVELSFRTTKLKSLGLHKSYRVEMWEGWKQQRGNRQGLQQKRYDSEIFPLYSSYSGGTGKETVVDGRQNMLARKSLLLFVPAVLGVIGFGAYYIFNFFHKGAASPPKGHASVVGSAQAGVPPANPPPAVPVGPHYSTAWRIVGSVVHDGARYVALKGEAGLPLRFVPAAEFRLQDGRPVSGMIDGAEVTPFSGQNNTGLGGIGQGASVNAADTLMRGGAR
jgi:zona occludens toxin